MMKRCFFLDHDHFEVTLHVLCVQDGRDGAVAAAESGRPGADCCGHSGHHEGLQGKASTCQSSSGRVSLRWCWTSSEKDQVAHVQDLFTASEIFVARGVSVNISHSSARRYTASN